MKIINFTPHAVTLRNADGVDHTYPSEGVVRVSEFVEAAEHVAGLPVPVRPPASPGGLFGLPDPTEGTAYIVSAMALAHPDVAGRTDVFAPATGPEDGVIRYPKGHPQAGQIQAVTRLVGHV